MERASDIITKIYQKYLPIAEKLGVSLDIDFPDTTLMVDKKSHIEKELDKSLKNAVSRARGGYISIAVRPGKIIITDNGAALSKAACERLSTEHVMVKSRVGFGTTATILG